MVSASCCIWTEPWHIRWSFYEAKRSEFTGVGKWACAKWRMSTTRGTRVGYKGGGIKSCQAGIVSILCRWLGFCAFLRLISRLLLRGLSFLLIMDVFLWAFIILVNISRFIWDQIKKGISMAPLMLDRVEGGLGLWIAVDGGGGDVLVRGYVPLWESNMQKCLLRVSFQILVFHEELKMVYLSVGQVERSFLFNRLFSKESRLYLDRL